MFDDKGNYRYDEREFDALVGRRRWLSRAGDRWRAAVALAALVLLGLLLLGAVLAIDLGLFYARGRAVGRGVRDTAEADK